MRNRICFLLLAMTTIAICAPVFADVPTVISYQGKVMESNGVPKPDNSYRMTFSIYDAATGGNCKWRETNPAVQVKGGLFNVMLGSVTPFPAGLFDSAPLYFGVAFESETEMTPRQQIGSVAFAQVSKTVVDGAITVTKLADNAVNTNKIADGAVTSAKLGPGMYAIPARVIVMWSGAISDIPAGWALCDGQNGTPDLRDKFVIGAGSTHTLGQPYGSATHTHTVNSHSHTIDHSHYMSHSHHGWTGQAWYQWQNATIYTVQTGNVPPGHNHEFWTDPSDRAWTDGPSNGRSGAESPGTSAADNTPPCYALAYIMRLP